MKKLMEAKSVKFKDWVFEVYREMTEQAYRNILASGTETCGCTDCKNYIAYRDHVFPKEVIKLFADLGIDYRKEVEVTFWETLSNGLLHIGGWHHFKGRVLTGKDYRISLPSGGHTIELTPITDNFSIGFAEDNDLTLFGDKTGLVQVEFDTIIPWVIDEVAETA